MKKINIKYYTVRNIIILNIAFIFIITLFVSDFYRCICHISNEKTVKMDCCENNAIQEESSDTETHDCCKKEKEENKPQKNENEHKCNKCIIKTSEFENQISTPVKNSESLFNFNFTGITPLLPNNNFLPIHLQWKPPDKEKIFINISNLRI